jgi:BirA family biotin operon repressor/biotin-[acetyl-CoA-carboxylase] ligase
VAAETAPLYAVARHLADGRFHSGTAIAADLGLSRAAVWKRVRQLADAGLEVHRVPGRGYRLAAPLDLLDAAAIRAMLGEAYAAALNCLEVLFTTDSTNAWMQNRAARLPEGGVGACIAECQTAGRGRRGRDWVSPFGANIYLSVGWNLHDLPPELHALSLAAGIAAAAAVEDCGFAGVGLKWPNDLVWRERKLGGILVEVQGQPGGACRLVVGVGINVAMPAAAAQPISQPWVDLAAIRELTLGLRSRLAGRLIRSLMDMLRRYARTGFGPFADAWRARDAMAGRRVDLLLPDGVAHGVAAGVDAEGALCLKSGGRTRRYFAGEISLRAVAGK